MKLLTNFFFAFCILSRNNKRNLKSIKWELFQCLKRYIQGQFYKFFHIWTSEIVKKCKTHSHIVTFIPKPLDLIFFAVLITPWINGKRKTSVTNSCTHQPQSQVFCSFQLLAPKKEKPLRKKLCKHSTVMWKNLAVFNRSLQIANVNSGWSVIMRFKKTPTLYIPTKSISLWL